MNIEKSIAQKILGIYGICDVIREMEGLVNIDFLHQGERIIKYYTRVHTDSDIYILKLMRLPMCPDIVLEKQAELSQKYRENGIRTPKCYKSGESYCTDYRIEELELKVLLEEDAGEMLDSFSRESILQIAELLGKMHAVALKNKWTFRIGSFYREFGKGNTGYLQLWNRTGTEFLPQNQLENVVKQYNVHLEKMKESWEKLPVATVQGDMYRMNLMRKDKELTIIDYDRAGDEVLLADLLITWFRILFDPVVREAFPEVTDQKLWTEFLNKYENERRLTEEEQSALAEQYAVLGAVYGTRRLVELAIQGKKEEAAAGLKEILEILG